jgi:hypothetical protein
VAGKLYAALDNDEPWAIQMAQPGRYGGSGLPISANGRAVRGGLLLGCDEPAIQRK